MSTSPPSSAVPSTLNIAAANSSGAGLPQIVQRKWCGHYAISSEMFDDTTVGAKSLNTLKLRVSCLCSPAHGLEPTDTCSEVAGSTA